MAPLLIPIVTMLANKGMSLLSSALEAGEDKAVDFIEQKTGIRLSEPGVEKRLGAEELAKLKIAEQEHAIELMRISLANKQEDNRHDESIVSAEVGDKQNARGSNHLYALQTSIANKIYSHSMWMIPGILIMNAGLIVYADKLNMDTTAVVAVGNLIGMALNSSYRERQSMIEFLYGASVGKKDQGK